MKILHWIYYPLSVGVIIWLLIKVDILGFENEFSSSDCNCENGHTFPPINTSEPYIKEPVKSNIGDNDWLNGKTNLAHCGC